MADEKAREQWLVGKCVLIVEDDYLLASDLAKGLSKAGFEIVGPVPSPARALRIVEDKKIDCALLDIKLDGDKVYEVADALISRGVPVVFVTGYDVTAVPARFRVVPLCQKPANVKTVIEALERASRLQSAS